MIYKSIYNSDGISSQQRDLIFRKQSLLPDTSYPNDVMLPAAYTLKDNGTVSFNLYYPNAGSVELDMTGTDVRRISLTENDGFWHTEVSGYKGFVMVTVYINGDRIINEYLPIGFHENRPMNYILIPDDEMDSNISSVKHGSVVSEYIDSMITGRTEQIKIYLPYSYHKNTEEYPVLYLQHGFGENEGVWVNEGKINFIYDVLIENKKAEPAIVVMCNGMVSYKEKKSVKIEPIGKFEEFLIKEVIPFIDSHYRTLSDRDHRAMAGLSMGSMQTSYITMRNPELFSWAGLFSGFVDNFLTGENEHLQNLDDFGGKMKLFFRAMGNQDPYLEHFEKDDQLLKDHGISGVRKIYEGSHEWNVWRQCFSDFIQRVFK